MIARESLEPLVGRMVRLTRKDIPGCWNGLLQGSWWDGVVNLLCKDGCGESIPINQIATVELEFQTPPHYAGQVTPWDLQKCMQSSGNAFVDARRTDAIEYCFRMKDDLPSDLKKAKHCIEEAIKVLEDSK